MRVWMSGKVESPVLAADGASGGSAVTPRAEGVAPSGSTNVVTPELPARRMLNGVVSAVDPAGQWIDIKLPQGVERFLYATNAHVLLTGKPVPVTEIRSGDRVGILARPGTADQWQLISVRIAARPPGEGDVKRKDSAVTRR